MSSNLQSSPNRPKKRYNSTMPPLLTHTFLPNSRPIDSPEASQLPLLCPCIDASSTARLASKVNLPRVLLTAAADAVFGIYQDWVHQNPSIYMYGGINKDDKWQVRWEKMYVCPPKAMTYRLVGSVKGLS